MTTDHEPKAEPAATAAPQRAGHAASATNTSAATADPTRESGPELAPADRMSPQGESLHETRVESPVGHLRIVASGSGLRAILWPTDSNRVRIGETTRSDHPILASTVRQLAEYFGGERTSFDLPLDPVGTDFQKAVWAELSLIPYGETVSYGTQAARLRRPTAVRAVAAANGKNPISIVVPCHRVVGADGSLTGFAGGIDAKRWLIDHEAPQLRL